MKQRTVRNRPYSQREIEAAIKLIKHGYNRHDMCECGEKGDKYAIVTQLSAYGYETLNAIPICDSCLDDLREFSPIFCEVPITC